MIRQHTTLIALAVTSAIGEAQSPQFTVVPATATATDAIGMLWLPGAGTSLRQQEIVGASHLQSLVGRTLTALEFRRQKEDRNYSSGSLNLTVTLSISPNTPLTTSSTFANNIGPNPIHVFSGQLQLPASPATTTTPAWTAANVLRVPFQTPFVYAGGTLCVDVVGTAVAGQVAGWWPADAQQDLATGLTVDLGGGCGTFGGPQHRWSTVEARTVLPGGLGHCFAFGPLGSFGILAIGTEFPPGWPLAMLLSAAAPSCTMFIGTPFALALLTFAADPPGDARADYLIAIPNTAAVTGASLTSQWVEWTQQASSNAITWTIGGVPGIDMSHVDGYATDSVGVLFVDLAHVLRFEHN